jgi:hypothetical protein
MSKDKGKAPATSDENTQGDGQENGPRDAEGLDGQSMVSRIAASAAGLTRSTFRPPNRNEVNDASVLASSDKARPLASGQFPSQSSTWAESSQTSQQPSYSQTSEPSLRSGQTKAHVRNSELEFSSFLDGIESFVPSEGFGTQASHLNSGFDEAWHRSQTSQSTISAQSAPITVPEQESRDGDGVLAILSEPDKMEQFSETPLEDDENYDWGLSSDQISKLREITKDIFPPPERHIGVSSDNPMNLLPDLSNESMIAKEHWKEQWERVLTGYADEVWGGLLPLIKEARTEVEDISQSQKNIADDEKPKALRRLEAILGHLQRR